MLGRCLRSPRVWWFGLWGLAVLLRLGVMLARPDQMTIDRDLYLGIATELREGHGYSTPGSEPPTPTAFRPPLYPWLLVLAGGSSTGMAVLHLLLAVVMVQATGCAAERLAGEVSPFAKLLAGGIVALDPLLLLYSGQPMTETLCSCLTAVLLWRLASAEQTPRGALIEGAVWGLCLLSRPTYAAALGLCVVGRVWLRPGGRESSNEPANTETGPRLRFGLLVGVTALVVVSPWAIRNWLIFGKPITTTTHGGYTLWLANNPVYYAEVVEGGDAAWNGESLHRWQSETNAEMDRLHIQGEVARDRWQAARAQQFIANHPGRFVRAGLYRAGTFWSIFPGRTAETGVPVPMLWIIAIGYAALWVGGVVALGRLWRLGHWAKLWPGLSLILGFFIVHLIYWTDARMRAPIMPAVALFVAVGCRGWRATSPNEQRASGDSGSLSPAIDVTMTQQLHCGGEGEGPHERHKPPHPGPLPTVESSDTAAPNVGERGPSRYLFADDPSFHTFPFRKDSHVKQQIPTRHHSGGWQRHSALPGHDRRQQATDADL